ncbi:ATP-binding protein [Streptococcus oriscaviae]|uniref:ATP-binding protein n=1 Tax=Streptococcus oriscaviae TaxID=2781599 RepID=A0ABX7YIN5_9STRE|nr:ATP-binding protein [Streptococcus oriscaviae]QUE53550.1 ATP-binding protein [Streptococcus oriscaviae]
MRVTKLEESNVWAFHENLVLMRDGSVFGIYRIPSMVANTMSSEGKEKTKAIVSAVVGDLIPYVDFEINDVPMPRDIIDIMEKLSERLDDDEVYIDLANTIFNKMIQSIYETNGQPFEYYHYLTVPLKSLHISVDMKEVMRQGYRHVKDVVLQGLGLQEDISSDWHKKYHEQRLVLEKHLTLLNAVRIPVEESILLNRIQYLRGMHYDKDYEILSVKSSVQNLDDVNISFENVSVLKLSSVDEESYVGFYPVDQLPTNVSYLHLMEEIHKLNFSVESKIKAKFPSTKGYFSLMGQTKRAQDKIKNAVIDNEKEGDGVKTKQVVDHHLLEDIEERISAGEKMISYMHVLILTADSLEELKARRNILRGTLSSIGVGVLEANADQVYLFYKTMLGKTLEFSDRNFIQKISIEGFAENLFFVSQKVGTDVGFYLGKVDNQIESWFGDYRAALASSVNLVFSDVLEANKQDVHGKVTNNPHIAVTGDTGSGKSFLLKLLFVYHSLLRTKSLYIDPKDEIKGQFLKVADELEVAGLYPELVRYIRSFNFVSLDVKNKENKGMLDPIVFLDRAEGKSLATTMVKTIKPAMSDKQEKGFLEALNQVYSDKEAGLERGMLHVFELMAKSEIEEVCDLGELLFTKSTDSVLNVAFSRGENKGIDTTSKITVVGIKNLELPLESSKLEITDSERDGLVILYAIGYFCKKFGSDDHSEETLMIMDEVWLYKSTSAGQKILNDIKRLGRSQNNFLLVGTQSVADIETGGDETGFGTVFAFYEEKNPDRVLDFIKVPITQETQMWLQNMTMAQCIYYDTYGRKERMTVDGTIFPEMARLFDTVKVKSKDEKNSWEALE